MVSAIILAGGAGTRLAPIIPSLPKALAPIQGIPFLQLMLEQLEKDPIVSEIIFALGYQAEAIVSFLHERSSPLPMHLSIEPSPLGTGGAILHALSQATHETLLILNGDSYSDLSFSHFLQIHRERKADLSIACRAIDDPARYGTLEIDASSRVRSFQEKVPKKGGWISAGIYLIQASLFTSFPVQPFSLEKDLFPAFLSHRVFAHPFQGTFIDIGTPESFQQAQEVLKPLL